MFSSNATQVSSDAAYIEDVFSTWLYTGNGSTQTINNGIDLAGKGGLVWLKARNQAFSHALVDTVTGASKYLSSNTSSAQLSGNFVTAFNANGFTEASGYSAGTTLASWTFREQPRFFDIVTYTGNGVYDRIIPHNLGSAPRFIIVKSLNFSGDWNIWHFDGTTRRTGRLNSSDALSNVNAGGSAFGSNLMTSTGFSVGDAGPNFSGNTYVAYLFAHDAGGFGASGSDNVISCGSFTGNTTVNLGYEPQWILYKDTQAGVSWNIVDVMRGWSQTTNSYLFPNLSNAELTVSNSGLFIPTATGFSSVGEFFNSPHIYIAIRRGPMRTPTSGTSVFAMDTYRATSPALQSGFVVDMFFNRSKSSSGNWDQGARLIGANYLRFNTTNVEATAVDYTYDYQNGVRLSGGTAFPDFQGWMLRRAPGFFDVVCYTGNDVARTVNHNLGAAPELMIIKSRSNISAWFVYSAYFSSPKDTWIRLNADFPAETLVDFWPSVSSNTFGLPAAPYSTNLAGRTYVAYLFASCPGVSKVGSFTGTGNTQTINCGFAAGARFVLIKRTDSTGDWYVWDSARGIVAGNDPYLLLNSTAAEVTNTDWVDTAASGFELSNAGGNLVNINGASYIFLSVA